MKSLRDIQVQCSNAFRLNDPELLNDVVMGNHIPATSRIEVYANNYLEIRRGALANGYPVLLALAGAECFRSLAHAYGKTNTSTSGDLQDFGARFPDYLDSVYANSEFKYFGDVARLELAIEHCLVQANRKAINPESFNLLAERDPSILSFEFAPSLQLLRSSYPIVSVWKTHQSGMEDFSDIQWQAESALMTREDSLVRIQRISDLTYQLVTNLKTGASLGAAVAQCEIDDQKELGAALKELALSNAITEIRQID